ncbi:class I SAM-dependent methyltransferase [Streptomyces cavernae]|uniref:class I SAM-dependent methyltransferase n=1 Tax=Streptomyces cavernae TaxID=2259034 RepID=UPI000FEBB384|nr:class I SAM-dependent methyltransferase [Streptomyces cavernae]
MTSEHGHASHHDGPHGHHGEQHDDAGQAEILDLDAEVLAAHIADITARLPLTAEPRRIVDLGTGTGAGTFALLDRFPDAQVTAVDSSAGHLALLQEKACARGLNGRVHTVQADLDADTWPDLGRPDLVWASASMHHMARPDRALRTVHELLTPGGLFAVVELAGFPRFLPAHAPEDRPGLEERAHAATDHFHAEHVPHRGADWGPMLTAAGFDVEDERTITVNIDGTRSDAVGRYALRSLQRIRGVAAPALDAEDLAALDALLHESGPHSIARRDDLAVRTERTVWAARRP